MTNKGFTLVEVIVIIVVIAIMSSVIIPVTIRSKRIQGIKEKAIPVGEKVLVNELDVIGTVIRVKVVLEHQTAIVKYDVRIPVIDGNHNRRYSIAEDLFESELSWQDPMDSTPTKKKDTMSSIEVKTIRD